MSRKKVKRPRKNSRQRRKQRYLAKLKSLDDGKVSIEGLGISKEEMKEASQRFEEYRRRGGKIEIY